MKPGLEGHFERGLFASRWLMAPMYLGLVAALLMLPARLLGGGPRPAAASS